MIIRPATPEDYERFMAMMNDFVGEDRYSSHANDSFRTVLDGPNSLVFVAERDGQLAGLATCSFRHVVRYLKPIAELDELYVDPNFRGHGAGSLLMEAVESAARERGCYRLYIESGYNHTSGHKLYDALGYKNNGYHFHKAL